MFDTSIKFEELKKPVQKKEYENIIYYAIEIGIKNAFCQENETVSESFIPNFNFDGIKKQTSKN